MLGFNLSNNRNSRVGVDLLPTGVAVVNVAIDSKNRGLVKHCDFLPAVGYAEQTKVLQHWVDRNDLKKTRCVSLISKHDVHLFQLEKPAVEEDELLQAVIWKVKDLISYDVSAAVLDVFELPPSTKSPVSYINAVVANESVVANYVEVVNQSGLELEVIDVHDLVAKNYTTLKDFSEQTVSILQFSEHDGMISIYKGGDLYVFRDFKIGLMDIEATPKGNEELYDSLLLELQRSMDYFESTYAMGLVQKMIVFPQNPATERMATYLQNNVAYEIDFAHIAMSPQMQSEQLDSRCFAAYCAALR
jgi:MSHA biogenesis protein MshI